jgi:hypothetical protein
MTFDHYFGRRNLARSKRAAQGGRQWGLIMKVSFQSAAALAGADSTTATSKPIREPRPPAARETTHGAAARRK